MSATRPGSVTSASRSASRPAPRLSRMFSTTARYSRASSAASSVAGLLGDAISTSTHRACPVPGTAVPSRARSMPRTATAGMPPGSSPGLHDLGHHADRGVAAVDEGDEHEMAAGRLGRLGRGLASSDSSAMVKTIPGSTTPEVRGSRGRFWTAAGAPARSLRGLLRRFVHGPPGVTASSVLEGSTRRDRTCIPLARAEPRAGSRPDRRARGRSSDRGGPSGQPSHGATRADGPPRPGHDRTGSGSLLTGGPEATRWPPSLWRVSAAIHRQSTSVRAVVHPRFAGRSPPVGTVAAGRPMHPVPGRNEPGRIIGSNDTEVRPPVDSEHDPSGGRRGRTAGPQRSPWAWSPPECSSPPAAPRPPRRRPPPLPAAS